MRRPGRRSARWAWCIALGLLCGGAGIGAQWLASASGVWINVTQSLPMGLYRMVNDPIRRGSYVLACPPRWAGVLALERGYLWRGPCPGGVARLGKRVTAVAGDTVELTDSGLVINGTPIPNSAPLTRDTRGRLLPVLRGRWVVLPAAVWLWAGWSARSFDSRYFGAVPLSNVESAVQRM